MSDEKFVAYVSRPKSAATAALMSAVAAFCFAVAWAMFGTAHGQEGVVLSGAIFFAGLALRYLWHAIFDSGEPLLVIDGDGFYCRLLSNDKIPWSAIAGVGYSPAALRPLSVEMKERRYIPHHPLSFRATPSRVRLWLPAMKPASGALIDFLSRTGRLGQRWRADADGARLPDYPSNGFATSFAWHWPAGLLLLSGPFAWLLASEIGGAPGVAMGGVLFACTAIWFVWLRHRMKGWPIFAMDRNTIYWRPFLDRPIPWSAVETLKLVQGWRKGYALSVTLTGGSSFAVPLAQVSRAAEAIHYLRLTRKLPWDSDTGGKSLSAGSGLAMDRGIKVTFNDATGTPINASLTPDQLSAIRTEFQSAREWKLFLEYCRHRMQGETVSMVRSFDRFSQGLTAIIARHTLYGWPLLWDVVDALYENHTESAAPAVP